MTQSSTTTGTVTFNITHAKHIASKVAADLKRFQRMYHPDGPSDVEIAKYEEEIRELLYHGALGRVEYGFKRNGKWTPATVRYIALPNGTLADGDDPGKIPFGIDVSGATFTSYLTYSDKWNSMGAAEKALIKGKYTLERVNAAESALEVGYWQTDKTYTAGGVGIGRSTVRS